MFNIGYYETRYYCEDPDFSDFQCIAYDAFRVVTDCPDSAPMFPASALPPRR